MCGIVGLISQAALTPDALRGHVERMSACISHRGPDDEGHWADPASGIALGFRRLAIIDVSPAGHQPMQSASGRYTIVFNGEVYNYIEIRAELEHAGPIEFRGHSDTEVILAAFERWGIEPSIRKFVGMFAMAVWDARDRRLSLIRDRLGIKPLYYYHRPGLFTFGSELKSIVSGPAFDGSIDAAAIDAYLRFLYVPAPLSIYRYVRKLLPGHVLNVDERGELAEETPYWSLEDVYRSSRANPVVGSDAEVVDELRELLSDAVRLRMRSDVPMGALLSGGIDSSTVVALMQRHASQPTRTFSIGFPGTPHDESEAAAAIARALGTDHTALAVTGADALAVVPELPHLFDEPFADPSQIPTYLVCRLARRDVTVALSGDGGDELFAGYERYVQGERLIRRMRHLPRALRHVMSAGIRAGSARVWERAYRAVAPALDPSGRHRLAGEKIRKLGNVLVQDTPGDMYRSLMSAGWQSSSGVLPDGSNGRATNRLDGVFGAGFHGDMPLLDAMLLSDQRTYLADDLLAKVDRASMAVSLEARVPLLDHRVVEFSWRLDRKHKVREGRGKWALRQVLYGMVDPALVDRPKTGFSVPVASWLRGPLRDWSEALLFDDPRDEWLSARAVRSSWHALLRGGDQEALAIWAAVMLQAWRKRWP